MDAMDNKLYDISSAIKAFVEDQFQVNIDGVELTVNTDLIDNGVIDSYGMIEVASFLENQFNVKLSDEDLSSPLLTSISGMNELVRRATGA